MTTRKRRARKAKVKAWAGIKFVVNPTLPAGVAQFRDANGHTIGSIVNLEARNWEVGVGVMTLISRLAREALPCRCKKPPRGVIGLTFCEPCNLRPAVEAAMRELVERCAERCDMGAARWQDETGVAAGWEAAAIEIRALLTDEEKPCV